MAKRKFFLKLELVTPQGSVLQYTDEREPPDTAEMRAACVNYVKATQRYLEIRKAETIKAKRPPGPRCGTVSIAEVAASPGLNLGATHHLDRQEREAADE